MGKEDELYRQKLYLLNFNEFIQKRKWRINDLLSVRKWKILKIDSYSEGTVINDLFF